MKNRWLAGCYILVLLGWGRAERARAALSTGAYFKYSAVNKSRSPAHFDGLDSSWRLVCDSPAQRLLYASGPPTVLKSTPWPLEAHFFAKEAGSGGDTAACS
jgi:hypothetical protein